MADAFFDLTGGAGLWAGPLSIGATSRAISIPAADYLTTGDLEVGGSGEFSALTEMTLEGWFEIGNAPAAEQNIVTGPDVTGRQWILSVSASGTLNFKVQNFSSVTQTVTTPYAIDGNVWYHVVCTRGSNVLRIYINGSEVANAVCSQSIKSGLTGGGNSDIRIGTSASTIAIRVEELATYRYALGADRVLAHYVAGTQRAFPQQTVDSRIRSVLDTQGSMIPRSIGTAARSIVGRYMTGQAPLDAIREAVEAESLSSTFFVKADGTLCFLGADHRSVAPYTTSQATFGDGAGELPYLDVGLDYSESFLFNDWNVTRTGTNDDPGATMSATDTASIARYKKRSQSLTGLPVLADTDSQNVATAMLAKYKDPMQRITSISLDSNNADATEAVLRRELMDKITVKRTPPGGGSRISQDLYIQKAEISASNDGTPWKFDWSVSPL